MTFTEIQNTITAKVYGVFCRIYQNVLSSKWCFGCLLSEGAKMKQSTNDLVILAWILQMC